MPYTLKLTRDTFEPGAGGPALPPLNRVLHVLAGDVTIQSGGADTHLGPESGWHGPRECAVRAGGSGATVLRYELVRQPGSPAARPSPGVTSTVLIEHAIDLDPKKAYLMRNDRVDFDPGGVALLHRHKGGGIRCLIQGSMDLRVEGQPDRMIKPGQAWFESGREPVYAVGDPAIPTSFIRVAILPREIKGQTSIMYVDPADTGRGKPRKYTVYVDEPIEI